MGLYDRDYMREDKGEDDPPPRRPRWIAVVAVILAFVFLLSAIL